METMPAVEEAEGMTLPPLPCVNASELISKTTDRAFHDVRRLANILSRVNLDARREDLLDYIRLNRARFMRAYVTVRWLSGRHGELVINASNALAEAQTQREQIDTCQDQFFFMHGALFGARQRLYDVPVAVDVLVNGRYPWLPKGIEYCGGDLDPRPIYEVPANRKEIIPRVDRAIRLALLRRGGIPSSFTSHAVRDGALSLAVEGEFELLVTLQAEREDAKWTLLGVKVKIQARQGEAVTAPPTDMRQQSYLHEVVQKAMDVHSTTDQAKSNPLLAAYQVCHDLCCSMMLGILHAQAQKLATRIGGLWANQLKVTFDKDKEVLDLCIWQKEFSTGLAGTGRDVGVGGIRADDEMLRYQAITGIAAESTRAASLPPAPIGCRYMRVHPPVDRNGKIVVSLGTVGEWFQDRTFAGDDGTMADDGDGDGDGDVYNVSGKGRTTADVLVGAVQVHPDRLSCGQMLLAAVRTLASHKILALATDLEEIAQQLRMDNDKSNPSVSVVNGVTVSICPFGNGCLEISVDVKSGRYLIQDTLSRKSKSMARCVSRLGEALNLLPPTDTQSLSASITAALSGGRLVPSIWRPSSNYAQDGAQQDLRHQQVRRCLMECLALLLREEVETVWRTTLGMVPCQRWQALLGRADNTALSDSGLDLSVQDGFGTLRSFVCLAQFREEGVKLSDEWRRRRVNGRLRRRGPGVIELTTAERAATPGRVPLTAPDGTILSQGVVDPLSVALGLSTDWHQGDEGLPGLVASLAEMSDTEDVDASTSFIRAKGGSRDSPGEKDGNVLPACDVLEDTGEEIYFFLEVAVTASMKVKHMLIVASLSTAAGACPSRRPKVNETYHIRPSSLQQSSYGSYGSLEIALLPAETVVGTGLIERASLLGKRSASDLRASDSKRRNGTNNNATPLLPDSKPSYDGLQPLTKRMASTAFFGGLGAASDSELFCSPIDSTGSLEAVHAYEVAHLGKCLIPYARLQHALTRVGTGIALDLHSLTQLPSPLCEVSHCTVLLGGEEGWSSAQLAATAAIVRFLPGHSQADSWEWNVTLSSATQLMDHTVPCVENTSEYGVVHEHLSLLENMEIGSKSSAVEGEVEIRKRGYVSVAGDAVRREKFVRLRFPASFSVHTMCRSFALAGEGLTAMLHLTSQAAKLLHSFEGGGGYGVVSFSPMHVELRDFSSRHVVLLTHSAFSAVCIGSSEPPALVLIPQPEVPTCPAALRELEASVRKHQDLSALLHGLSRILPGLAVVARVVPGVGQGMDTPPSPDDNFGLAALSPACFVLSDRSAQATLYLVVEAAERVRVSGQAGKGDVSVDASGLRDLLLEWIAPSRAQSDVV